MTPSPHLQALLRAGRAERPPEGNEQRLLAALGVGTGVAAAGGLGAGTLLRSAWRTWARWLGLSLLVTAAAGGAAWRGGAQAPQRPHDAVASTVERESPPVPAPVTLQAWARPELAAPFARSALPGGRTPSHPAPASDSASEDELAYLGRARAALAGGAPTTALAALEEHRRAFPRGTFAEEAAALRVQTLVALGRTQEAWRAADAFNRAFPRSPYGPRVDALRPR